EAASWLLECLSALRDAGDTPGLLAAFRAFSEALLLLGNLTAKHLQELGDCPRQKSLARNLQLLQKCVPLLHAAKRSDLKCSWDRRVKLSKDSAFQLTERTIEELVSLLVGTMEPQDRAGTFSQHRSELLALLSHPQPLRCSSSELSAHVDAVVFYSMLLANTSRADLKLELAKRCWVLLQLRKSICGHVGQQEGQAGESSLEKERHSMREELETLDQAVLTATLCQVLDTFEGEEPLRPLVEAALHLTATGCFPAGPGGFLKKLQPLTATFFTHAQQMLRVTDFVLARCTKTQTTTEIGEWVNYLQSLLARLPALLTEMSRNTSQASAAERLCSLYCTWAGAREGLLRCFEETVGVRELLELSIREMAKDRERCDTAWECQDHEMFWWHVARLSSWARWMVGATTRHVDRATDPIFRNGLLVWVRQLANSIPELEAVAARCPEGPSRLQTRDIFSRAASGLMDAARRVCDGLDGANHPDILSPLRAQVRNADVAKGPELSPGRAGLKTITGETVVQEDIPNPPLSQPGGFHADVAPRQGDAHPVITALLAATRAHDMAAVDVACSALLELSGGCVAAAKEALPVAEPLQMQALGQHRMIASLTPRVISLARETALRQLRGPSGLLQMALMLSERIRETKECLAAVAGPWYSLAQQAFGFFLSADFLHGEQALEETMTSLSGTVQFAGDIASMACSKGNLISPDVWESFLEMQAKFSRAQMTTEALLEKAASCEGSCGLGKASLELHCTRWAVSMHVLLHTLDRFIGGDVLLLRELSSAVQNKLCSQSLLATVSEISLRLQEAARLSALSCPDERSRSEILALREEVEVLVEALLDASSTLSLSPLPTASLSIRWKLLQRDLALRAKALLLHLEKVNAQQLRVIRDVIEPALSPFPHEDSERRKEAFEEKASRLMANVQWVKTTLQDVQELQSQEKLLSVAEHLLLLTFEAVGSARRLLQSRGDKGHPRLTSAVWYWAAMAHYLLTQLHTGRGLREHVLQLIGQCLRNTGDQRCPCPCGSTAEMSPALSHPRAAGTCLSRSGGGCGAAWEAREMVQ
ncbi:CTNA1 protein, partial [Caloenas nicobarica]|nr:CTNA1 protein [Caloenas nicobarica]